MKMSNEELLNAYEVAVVIYAARPKGEEGTSEENLNILKAEILRRMNK